MEFNPLSLRPSSLSPIERRVLRESWWLRRQWQERQQAWSAEGLAQTLHPYLKSLTQCWESVPVDGKGKWDAKLLRVVIWEQQAWLIGGLLEQLRP